MPRRTFQLTVSAVSVFGWASAFGQAAQPPQVVGVCGSQQNQPTVYFSGVLQGPASAFAGFRSGFAAFLEQHYAYKGAVGCLPANNAVMAQNFINTRATALRNAKRAVIETGWTEAAGSGASVAGIAAATKQLVTPAAVTSPGGGAPAAGASSGGGSASGGNAGGASQLSSILGAVFGTGSGGSAGTGGTAAKAGYSASAGGAAAGGAAAGGAAAANAGSTSGQNALLQVSNSLASVFGNKSTNAGSSGQGAAKSPQANASDGGLGGAQWQTTKLVVFGCGRQDMQIACVSNLTNQNQKDTLVQAADVWKDAFIVDDRGDRHPRSNGFFLNVDGDQRPQLDISYGKSARFVLMFDGVQTKVQKVALRSATGGLDVEEIALVVPGAAAANQ